MSPAQQQAEATPPVALDRIMLAMDVVDTLRHQRELVDRELDADRRQQQLVDRVQAIYESQGIEVTEDVIAEGVRALAEDRFVYSPPERTFAVRLAEVYVERGKWSRRLAVVLLLLLLAWAVFAVPAYLRRQNLIEEFTAQVAQIERSNREATSLGRQLEQRLVRATAAERSPAAQRLLAAAEDTLLEGLAQVEEVDTALAGLPPAADYPDDKERWDGALASYASMSSKADAAFLLVDERIEQADELRELQVRLTAAQGRLPTLSLSGTEREAMVAAVARVEAALGAGDLHASRAALHALDGAIDLALAARQREAKTRAQFAALATALDGVDVEAEAAQELAALRAAVEQAMQAGDWERAGKLTGDLDRLVTLLDSSYELRIVSRPSDRSGVWRHPNNDRRKRNYYIIVEAVDDNDRVLPLTITEEEYQTTSRVRRFGVRVPEEVYEQVKADKLDNGLIDNVKFGRKRRGARAPEYLFPVAGGHITRW